MYQKISRVSGTPARPIEHTFAYENTFVRELANDGTPRLKIGLRGGQATVLRVLGAAMKPPYRLLYVLHTSRTDAPLGRYESPDLDGPDIEAFLERFGTFIAEDSRHDVWMYSLDDGGPIIVDRHNMVYAYGPLERIAEILRRGGVAEVAAWAAPKVPYPHAHHYHPAFDSLETELLAMFDWLRHPLRDTDVQSWSGPQAS